jgi:cold shock CspA family protein
MTDSTIPRITGRVKFFDDERGYGFIIPLHGDITRDVFVHMSDLQPSTRPRKRALYTGEYVEFEPFTATGRNGEEQMKARHVTGVGGGSLLCEHGEIHFSSYSRINFNNGAVQTGNDSVPLTWPPENTAAAAAIAAAEPPSPTSVADVPAAIPRSLTHDDDELMNDLITPSV